TAPRGTSLLDGEAPLPPGAAQGSGLTAVLTAWLSVAVIVAACWLLNRPPIVREWFVTDFRPWCLDQWERLGVLGVAGSVLAAFYLMLAIHELGHAVAGLCVGFRLQACRLGPLPVSPPSRLSR